MRDTAPDLKILLLEITQKCNAACEHCGSRCDINSQELLLKEEILAVFKDVKENIGTDVMINISGGEPLMRADLFEIMDEVNRMGFDWGMVSNGVLINDSVIDKMKKTGMKTITISIDGLSQTHESLRHLPGSFDRIIENIKKLKQADFLDAIQVTFTSNKRNVYEFPELYKMLDSLGLDSIRTSFVDPIGRAADSKDLLLNRKEMEFIMDFVNAVNRTGRTPIIWGCCHFLNDKVENRNFKCFTGIYSASILYNGDIFVCPNVPRLPELIQGNIRTDSFSKVWRDGFEWFRNKPLPDKCKACQYRDECDADSVHTYDFDKNEPKFCYKEIFNTRKKRFFSYLYKKYGEFNLVSVNSDDPAPDIYIEPEAYDEIKQYFHMGKRSPISLFEQQMGLVGFEIDGDYVIKYAFPSHINSIASDLATFSPDTYRSAIRNTNIIRRNFKVSDDAGDYIGQGLKFLGFIHSHPIQEELCYSIGDEIIHRKMCRKHRDYIGILVNPGLDLIGAYYGEKIIQGNLKIIVPKKSEKG